ncbi:hypothetical protein HAX54_027485, partial [Datura stramonium]|nr:hypothetical protein [Datura stramonium]
TFKIETMMAIKWKISLAVPVLASIYNGLNEISSLPQLDLIKIHFPIHYVYGCLAHYFKTHYALANVPSNPLIVAFSGEGAARYFDKNEARKRIHLGDNIAWTSTMLNNSEPYNYIYNDEAQALESNYFMSIRFGYLSLRNGNSTIIKSYSPHRFSRQFGFYQRIPCTLANDNRSASLVEGLRYWHICVLDKSMSPGPISTEISEVAHQECSNAIPQTGNSFTPLGGKGSFPLSIAAHVSKKISSQGESNNIHEDRCWKKVRPRSDKSEDVDLAVVEIHDSVDSPSRTLTILIKESNSSGALPRERFHKRGESISGPNPIKSPSIEKIEKEATSSPRDRVRARSSSDLQKHPKTAVSVFDGKKARSALHDKDMEASIKEFSIIVGERLSNSILKEYEKIEKVSFIRQSLSEVKEKIEKLRRKEKDLEILLDTTEREVEEAKLRVSTVEYNFDACNDADLLNFDDLTDLKQKKECLKAMRQDLINYKLCLD